MELMNFQVKYQRIRIHVSRYSSVGIATGYGLDDQGGREFESWQGKKFSLLHIVQTSSGVHPNLL
jgi:hypothetical protein